MPAALLVPALALPVLQLVARRPRHRVATARLGAGGTHPVHPGRGGRRRLVLAAGDRRSRGRAHPRHGRAVDAGASTCGRPRATRRSPAPCPGISGTAAAIGGPFLALVLQHERPQRVRSTLAVFFVAGSLLGLTGLLLGGELTRDQVLAGLVWVPVRPARLRRGRPGPGADRPRDVPACGARPSACSPASPSSSAPRWPSLAGVPTRIDDPADPRLTDYVGAHRRGAAPAVRARARALHRGVARRSSGGRWGPGTGRGPTSWPSAGSPTSPTSSSGRRPTASPSSSASTTSSSS